MLCSIYIGKSFIHSLIIIVVVVVMFSSIHDDTLIIVIEIHNIIISYIIRSKSISIMIITLINTYVLWRYLKSKRLKKKIIWTK